MTNALTSRIRVTSAAPLPEFRIWVPVPQGIETIGDLKDHICKNVRFLASMDSRPFGLILELEDYELLDDSPINILRDGDILLIKQRPASKRKAKQQAPSSSSPQLKKRRLSTSSFSTTSSTSTDSSVTSSTTSATDSSSASEDSSTDTTPIKQIEKSQNWAAEGFTSKQSQTVQSLAVPPGLGKPSTHARNRRRKLKRQYEKRQPESASRDANWKQAGRASQTIEEGSMMDHNLPSFPTYVSGLLQSNGPASNTLEKKNSDIARPVATTFIPPSEQYPLPSNIIITSIDVEDNTYQDYSVVKAGTQTEELSYDIRLPDWDTIDKEWNTYSKITTLTPLSEGMTVGWRAFGLNPMTLTPEVSLLHLGRIVESTADETRVSVISRGKASFGGAVVEEEPEERLVKPRENIILEEWRVIDHP